MTFMSFNFAIKLLMPFSVVLADGTLSGEHDISTFLSSLNSLLYKSREYQCSTLIRRFIQIELLVNVEKENFIEKSTFTLNSQFFQNILTLTFVNLVPLFNLT